MIKKVLIPADHVLFKQELLLTKRARRTIRYKDGSERVEFWDAGRFTPASDLMNNINSQLYHRVDRAYIAEAIYEIDGLECLDRPDENRRPREIELYIHYTKGWTSFESYDEHVVEYVIENNRITLYYNVWFSGGKTEVRAISDRDMCELICILDDATAMNAFERSNTLMRTVHGPLSSFDYDYDGRSERECGSLFTDDSLNGRYQRLINRIIK